MKLFKHLREEALKKVSVGKVFEPTSSDDNKKDPAFSRKGKVATGDEGQLKYGAKNNDVHVTEQYDHVFIGAKVQPKHHVDKNKPFVVSRIIDDTTAEVRDEYGNKHKMAFSDLVPHQTNEEVDLDQKYSDWQDEVKQRNPQHAAKIKFKTNPDQRDTISAEHGDRSFGTFNTKTGEAIHLGEATEGNKFESAYDVVAHLAKAGYHGIQAKDVELYQGGRATARHRGSSASQHYGKCFSVNAAGDVKVHGDETSAIKAIKEEVELDEESKHYLVGSSGQNLTGHTSSPHFADEKSAKDYQKKFKHVPYIKNAKIIKGVSDKYGFITPVQEEVELDEDFGYENRDAKDAHLSYTQYMKKYYPSKYKGMWESEDCRICGQTPCNCTFINEEYKEKNYEYKNKEGKTATLSCATYSNGDTEHFVHIKGQRATRHATKNKAHQSLRVRGYEPTGKVEEE